MCLRRSYVSYVWWVTCKLRIRRSLGRMMPHVSRCWGHHGHHLTATASKGPWKKTDPNAQSKLPYQQCLMLSKRPLISWPRVTFNFPLNNHRNGAEATPWNCNHNTPGPRLPHWVASDLFIANHRLMQWCLGKPMHDTIIYQGKTYQIVVSISGGPQSDTGKPTDTGKFRYTTSK